MDILVITALKFLLQECYIDQMATEQLTIIYNGGCRAKDVRTYCNCGIIPLCVCGGGVGVGVGACRKLIEYLHVDYLISSGSKADAKVQQGLGPAVFGGSDLFVDGGCIYILDFDKSWMMYVLAIYKL